MHALTRSLVGGLALALVALGRAPIATADEKDGRFDIYFIDVEGGAATLFVTPAGESVLVDSGSADLANRDLNRILKVLHDAAGRKSLDHAVVSHWHSDHFGNHAGLASQIAINHFWDRGIPETLEEDKTFPERIGPYRAASQNKSNTLKVG
jgi:beta-lactamase superfamily II metal-dependent hydrolase